MVLVVVGLTASLLGSSVAAAAPSPEDAKSAQQIYADIKHTLRTLTSLRVQAQGTLQDTTTFSADISYGPAFTYEVDTHGPDVTQNLTTPRASYVRGGTVGPTWTLASTDPRCLMAGTSDAFDVLHVGNLTKGADTKIGTRRVVEIDDDGRAPGATPSRVYVALDGPPLPLQVVQTGPPTAGASCPLAGENPSVMVTSTWRPNVAIRRIAAPRHALDRRQAILAEALYAPAAQTLINALNESSQLASTSDPAVLAQSLTGAANAIGTYVTVFSTISFPPALQAPAQALLGSAKSLQSAATAAATGVTQGDVSPLDTFTQALTTFGDQSTTFEAQLGQSL